MPGTTGWGKQEIKIIRYLLLHLSVGVPNAIPRLARTEVKSTLAVSIHAPNQAIRESIIPSAKAYPIEALMQVRWKDPVSCVAARPT